MKDEPTTEEPKKKYERPAVLTLDARAVLDTIGPAFASSSGCPDPTGGGGGNGHGHHYGGRRH
jgi:hypothetical protein